MKLTLMKQYFKQSILKGIIMLMKKSIRRLLPMKKCPNEERIAKKSDLKMMRKQILKEDRKEDNKLYVKKPAKRKK